MQMMFPRTTDLLHVLVRLWLPTHRQRPVEPQRERYGKADGGKAPEDSEEAANAVQGENGNGAEHQPDERQHSVQGEAKAEAEAPVRREAVVDRRLHLVTLICIRV